MWAGSELHATANIIYDKIIRTDNETLLDALVSAHNAILHSVQEDFSVRPPTQTLMDRIVASCKRPCKDSMKLAYCKFCITALEHCVLDNEAVRYHPLSLLSHM